MKKGDKVYVNWPTGKGGPYETLAENNHGVRIKAYSGGDQSDFISVPRDWCEPVEPEIEEGRLVFATDTLGTSVGWLRKKLRDGYSVKDRVNDDDGIWYNSIKPVHRRWDELSSKERNNFVNVVAMAQKNKHVFHEAYKLITGEEHP